MGDLGFTVGMPVVTPTPKFTGIRVVHIVGGETNFTLPSAADYENGPLLVCCLDDSPAQIRYDDYIFLDGKQSTIITPSLNENGARTGAAVLLWPDEANGHWFGLSSGTWERVE
jgi:hypothetical protein